MRTFGALALVISMAAVGCSQSTAARRSPAPVEPLGSPAAPGTSREVLERTRNEMQARLDAQPGDAAAAVRLADALLRLARVTNNGGLAVKAERALVKALGSDPGRYDAHRMLAVVLLSQHRFRDAIHEAERCQQMRQNDASTWGVVGDARLELGEYDDAFAAFERMSTIRPDSASYARIAYARELEGDLPGALQSLQMALEATSPNDAEAIAWHHAQIGTIHLAEGRLAEAAREFAHADYSFPGHPFAVEGRARVLAAQNRAGDALATLEPLLAKSPSASTLVLSAEVLRALGKHDEAVRQDALAEALWRSDAPEPARLALMLANSGDAARIDEAVRVAQAEFANRRDIFTADALAWAFFKAGRLGEAVEASALALRTGSVDRGLRERARTIAHAASIAGVAPGTSR
jgi:tetratricopeptide (TPR) repeat protein